MQVKANKASEPFNKLVDDPHRGGIVARFSNQLKLIIKL